MHNNDRVLRAALFARVSTDEQAKFGHSIPAQKERLTEYCKANRLRIVDYYVDEGISGGISYKKRPEMMRLLKDVEAGKIDTIVFVKLDRWFRSVKEYYLVQEILDKNKVSWRCTDEEFSTDTASGQLSINLFLSIAENERARTRERILAVFEHKRKNKEVTFGAHLVPYGYRIDIDEQGKRRLVKDEEIEDAIQEFWDLAVKYENVSFAAKTISLKYGLVHRKTKWIEMSKNSVYSGVYKNIPSYCPAYVSYENWLKLQDRKNRVKQYNTDRIYLFSGMIQCPNCGNNLSGTYTPVTKKDGRHEYRRYRCQFKQSNMCDYTKTLSELKVEKWLLDNISKLIEGEIAQVEIEKQKPRKKPRTNTDALKEKLRRLDVMYMNGRKTDDEYTRELKELQNAIVKAEQETKESDDPHDRDISDLKSMLETDFKSLYATLDDRDRQRFWRSIIKQIHFKENTPTHVDFK